MLSGYLITGILSRSRDSPRYYAHFYVRRSARILPLYLLVLPAGFALAYAFQRSPVGWWAYLLMLQNFLSVGATVSFLIPAWSLAVEEQYYLVWPAPEPYSQPASDGGGMCGDHGDQLTAAIRRHNSTH